MISEQLNGARAWDCYQAYLTFITYLPMADTYSKSERGGFENKDLIVSDFKSLDDSDKKRVIAETLAFYHMSSVEMLKFVGVHQMQNKAYVSASTANNFSVSELYEMVIESIIKCSETSNGLFF